jgi:TolA-binding protein
VKKYLLFLFFVCISSTVVFAQAGRDEALAKSYFDKGEFEKAVDLYASLWEKNNQSQTFYKPLLECLYNLKQLDEGEKVIKKQIKKFPENLLFSIDLGYLYKQKGEQELSKKQFEKVIKDIRPNDTELRQIAEYFLSLGEFENEIATYEKGTKLFSGKIDYSPQLGAANMRVGDYIKAAFYFLTYIQNNPTNTQPIKNIIQTIKGGEKLKDELETQLYSRIQKQPDDETSIDFLTWIYVQNKDFESAIIQMKALDRRKNADGYKVLEIARMAQIESYYDDALSGYEYVTNKQPKSPLYLQARTEQLNCRKEKISKTINYTKDDVTALRDEYEAFINESGKNPRTAQSIKELADVEGFYLFNIPKAINICEELIAMPGITQNMKNQTKLSLGDFYLISGDVWESQLLYSQVDKEEKDAALGEEARFKNAKLTYFKGEFDWAQTQLNILKAATSQLISNDAINLSVFIIDNLGMDTIAAPMQLFANAELLSFQNKDDEANEMLDSLAFTYPGHDLYDDIEFAKSQIYIRKRQFEKAVPLLENIVQNFGKDLKGDDALFLLADINERHLNDKEKAKELFQKLITEFQNSLLVIEARKRFRQLRGDKLE